MCKRKLRVTQNIDVGGPRELVLLQGWDQGWFIAKSNLNRGNTSG